MEHPPGPTRPPTGGLRLLDLAGLVVGFGLAAFAVRCLASGLIVASIWTALALGLLYFWLGFAMSGPLILWLDRRGPPEARPYPSTEAASRFSGEEMAWIGVGCYLDLVTLMVLPAIGMVGSWPGVLLVSLSAWGILLGLSAVSIALLTGRFRPRSSPRRPASSLTTARWTRQAAKVLLWTWPLAWTLLIWLAN